jgi:hypothetical protein
MAFERLGVIDSRWRERGQRWYKAASSMWMIGLRRCRGPVIRWSD